MPSMSTASTLANIEAARLDYLVASNQSAGPREVDMDPHHEAAPVSGAAGVAPDIAALYQQHKDAMYGVARKMLRRDDQHRAEDVVQEAVLSVWRNPPEDVASWEALFVQAVKRKIYDLWKSAAHEHERLVFADAQPLEDELGGDDLGLDAGVVVEETHERAETVARVRGAIAELARTEPTAAYVYLQVKGLERTSSDVAAELGVSDSRVRQHVMKARKALIMILDTSGGGL